jgi:hypothetical protein
MCCGKGKARPRDITIVPALPRPDRPTGHGTPTFEYIGRTALTVFGPISGAPYRFPGPGSRLAVDPRDRAALSAVPVLKFVG